MAHRHMKNAQCHESSDRCKLKPQWDIISHLSEWLSSINQQTTSAGKDVEKGEPFCIAGGSANWHSHCGKQWRYHKKLKMVVLFDPAIQLLGIHPRTPIQKRICIPMFIPVLLIIAKIWKQPKCPLVDEWIKMLWCIYTNEYQAAVKKKNSYILWQDGWSWKIFCWGN